MWLQEQKNIILTSLSFPTNTSTVYNYSANYFNTYVTKHPTFLRLTAWKIRQGQITVHGDRYYFNKPATGHFLILTVAHSKQTVQGCKHSWLYLLIFACICITAVMCEWGIGLRGAMRHWNDSVGWYISWWFITFDITSWRIHIGLHIPHMSCRKPHPAITGCCNISHQHTLLRLSSCGVILRPIHICSSSV